MSAAAASALSIVTNALIEVGINAPGETPAAELANWAFSKLNDMLDEWAGDKKYVFAETFLSFTFTPNLQPHTIGPSGTFVVPIRPPKIPSGQVILNTSTPPVYQPMNVRDKDWWANERVPTLTTTFPTDFYYEEDWPNGSLFFWPVPTVAYGVRLEMWTLLQQIASLAATVSLPPAYKRAVTLSLAESLCPGGEKEVHPELAKQAAKARGVVFSNNLNMPRISTIDSGMPKSGGGRPDFNYYTGRPL